MGTEQVPHLDAELHVEILSSDVTGDQFLGSATRRDKVLQSGRVNGYG